MPHDTPSPTDHAMHEGMHDGAREHGDEIALLMGRGRLIEDVGSAPGTLHAVFVPAPIAPAGNVAIDTAAASAAPGVVTVLTGTELAEDLAAIVVAETPCFAADAAALVVALEPLPASAAPVAKDVVPASGTDTPPGDCDVSGDRAWSHGVPARAMAEAQHVVEVTVRERRRPITSLARAGVVAAYDPRDEAFTITTNAPPPREALADITASLGVPASHLRISTPPNAGDRRAADTVPPARIVALCAVARKAARPVAWMEVPLDTHWVTGGSPAEATHVRAAIRGDGLITALEWSLDWVPGDWTRDCPPGDTERNDASLTDASSADAGTSSPGVVPRLHAAMTGPYRIGHLAVRHRDLSLGTGRADTSSVRRMRDDGTDRVAFALGRLLAKIATTLGREPLAIIARNLLVADDFPYRTAAGVIYAGADTDAVIELAERADVLPELRFRRAEARSAGRIYGVGMAAVVPRPQTDDAVDVGGDSAAKVPSTVPAAHGLVLDLCGVEVDPGTGRVRIDRYVTIQDDGGDPRCWTSDVRLRGAFAEAAGVALFGGAADSSSGGPTASCAERVMPSALDLPDLEIVRLATTADAAASLARSAPHGRRPEPHLPTPAALANALADALSGSHALSLDIDDVDLPVGPSRILALVRREEPARPTPVPDIAAPLPVLSRDDFAVMGDGIRHIAASPASIWAMLGEPQRLTSLIPGCRSLDVRAPGHARATIAWGAGLIEDLIAADVRLSEIDAPRTVRLRATARGRLTALEGEAAVTLTPEGDGTLLAYRYGLDITGRTANVADRSSDGVARAAIAELFDRLAEQAAPTSKAGATASRSATATDGPSSLDEPRGWFRRLLGRGKKAGAGDS